ncbi:peroxidase 5-like protein, partial [Tanacetum coccineum]
KAESEQDHGAYARTLRGLDIIDQAKAMLEAARPNTVSCADILAFATRDSTNSVGGFSYAIPSGQQDGRISRIGKVDLPGLNSHLSNLRSKFVAKRIDCLGSDKLPKALLRKNKLASASLS